jgi:hypothetical protein
MENYFYANDPLVHLCRAYKAEPTYLVAETMCVTPHTETGIEIANRFSESGFKVVYAPLFLSVGALYWHSRIGGYSHQEQSISAWFNYVKENLRPEVQVDSSTDFERTFLPSLASTSDFTDFQFDGVKLGEACSKFYIWNNNLNIHQFHALEYSTIRETLESYLVSSVLAYMLAHLVAIRHRVTHIVYFNGRTPTTYGVASATKKLGLKSLIHERGKDKDHYCIRTEDLHLINTEANAVKSFAAERPLYQSKENAAIYFERRALATPQEWYPVNDGQTSVLREKISEHLRDSVVFFLSSLDELDAIVGTQDYGEFSHCEAVWVVARACLKLSRRLVIRSHPLQRYKESELLAFRNIGRNYGAEFIEPDDPINSLHLGLTAHCVLTYGSSIGWELMYRGVPVAVLRFSPGRDWDGVLTLQNEHDIAHFIAKPDVKFSEFPIRWGDYMYSLGTKFKDFNSKGFGQGSFQHNAL